MTESRAHERTKQTSKLIKY